MPPGNSQELTLALATQLELHLASLASMVRRRRTRLAAPLILAAHTTNGLLAGQPPLAARATRPCFAPATAPAVDDETDFVSADDLEREAFAEEVVVRSKGPTAAELRARTSSKRMPARRASVHTAAHRSRRKPGLRPTTDAADRLVPAYCAGPPQIT